MPFDILSAWLVAVGSITLLVAFGNANRRSGWTRKRSDLILDSLMLNAEMQQSERQVISGGPAEISPLPNPVTATSDLFALTRALETGVSPACESALELEKHLR